MDFLIEQVVHRTKTAENALKKLLIVIIGISIPILLCLLGIITEIYYFFVVAIFSVMMEVYGIWYFWTSLNIDYEYSLFNSELTVSKIISNRKRKDIVKIKLSSVTQIKSLNELQSDTVFKHEYIASKDNNPKETVVLSFDDKKYSGISALFFSPNEKLLSAIRKKSINARK